MRVRFFQANDEGETAAYLAMQRRVREFWSQFTQVQATPAQRWAGQLRAHLRALDEALGLEVDVRSEAERFLYVLGTDGASSTALAEAIVEQAPQVWPWTIATRRPPTALETALRRVRQDTGFELSVARARVGVGRGHGVEVVLGSHWFRGADDEEALGAAELLVSTLVGDQVFEHWITGVEVATARRPSPLRVVGQEEKSLPLALPELQDAVFNAVHRITSSLPEQPYHRFCEHGEWVLFEVSELPQVNVAERPPLPDLRMATTMCPEMLKCFLSAAPFASERFSAHDEHFCYLQLRIDGSEEERLRARTDYEEDLDRILVPGGLGCVVGAGLGDRFMYIVLAVQALDPTISVIVRRLRQLGAARESWIRFCDDKWRDEWVGAYDDTPPPLGYSDEKVR